MKKKIFLLILVMLLTCTISSEVFAAAFVLDTDVDVLRAGEPVSVMIKLDKTIPEKDDITNIQGELYYDPTTLLYVSHEMSKDYGHYMSMDRTDKERFQFSNTSIDNTPFEVPKGEIVTIVFETAKDITEPELEATFTLKMKLYAQGAEATEMTTDASIVICQEHVDINTVTLPDNTENKSANDSGTTKTTDTDTLDSTTAEITVNSDSENVVDNLSEDKMDIDGEKMDDTNGAVFSDEEESTTTSEIIEQETPDSTTTQNENEQKTAIVVLGCILVLVVAFVLYKWYQRKKKLIKN